MNRTHQNVPVSQFSAKVHLKTLSSIAFLKHLSPSIHTTFQSGRWKDFILLTLVKLKIFKKQNAVVRENKRQMETKIISPNLELC